MAAVLLSVNSDGSSWDGVHAADLEVLRGAGVLRKAWPVDELPTLDGGDDVWLVSVGDYAAGAGLLGHGTLAGSVGEKLQYGGQSTAVARSATNDGGGPPGAHLLVDIDALLPRGDEIPLAATLGREDLVTGHGLGGRVRTVRVLPSGTALELRLLWSAHMPPVPGSSTPGPGMLPAAAMRRGTDNRFETDAALRRTVLAHRGSVCHGCGLDGEQAYGPAGADLMQVHLITPLPYIDEDFAPDGLVDLVPLCPTCHVVVHSGGAEPFTVGQVRSMLRSHGFLRGAVLTEHQLEAEDAAGRILEAGH